MPKTYTSVPNVATGDILTATPGWNTYVAQNINNLRVPPMVVLTAGISGNTLGGGDLPTTITAGSVWTQVIDTDDMWTSGVSITIQTAGLYLVTLSIIGDNTVAVRGDIIHNSTTVARENNASVNPGAINASAIISAAAADTVKATGATSGGTSGGVRFSAVWVGQVS